jgi:hypothetical protein
MNKPIYEDKSSSIRRRVYSDFDKINLNSLKLNMKASLQKQCEKKIGSKVCEKKIGSKSKAKKRKDLRKSTLKKLKPQQLQKRHSKFKPEPIKENDGPVEINSASSHSSSISGSDKEIIDQSVFNGFDFNNAAKPKSPL